MIGYAPGHVKALYQISMVQRATSASPACQLLSSPGWHENEIRYIISASSDGPCLRLHDIGW